MSNGSNDWSNNADDEPQLRDKKESGGDGGGYHPPGSEGAGREPSGGSGRSEGRGPSTPPPDRDSYSKGPPIAPPGQGSLFDKTVETIKLVFSRSMNSGIFLAYLALFGVWFFGSGMLIGGLVFAMFAAGAIGSSGSPELAGGAMMTALIGGGAVFMVAAIAWQNVLVGLLRPIHRVMFEGEDVFPGVGAVLRSAVERFFPILGVNVVLGLVFWGGAVFTVGAGLVPLVTGANEGVSLALVGVGVLAWLVVSLVLAFFLGPATYFAATRDLGVGQSLGKAFGFVRANITPFLVAWLCFLGCALAVGCVAGVISAIPCLGSLVQIAVNAVGGFLAMAYWAGVHIVLEHESDSSLTIV